MSSPSPSNLACLKAQADFCASMADLEFKTWRNLHDALEDSAAPFANMAIRQNIRMLGDCTCVPIRELLQRVLKAQRDLAKSARALKEWVRKEKRAHRAFEKMLALL
ncbi:hypothetical protein HBH70_007520 [Parastagonospora nodorum]|nr:hypothetical protein HBH53_076160 [Parastagonospora nodorum]KAH3987304.1 hypothetical protein HBH52_038160 [Parastagonospora nodorum]KAH4127880.1 hypothetical protein HBH47_038280 [Parastagonospora nodorum]KAH4200216.1 hypothetical protein HBH42_041210 [Parastagonospora nodorum]KAH4859815.1 hypothetical protein HBH75_045760 [Parastagonospora nodorum]